ncbi:hypothetical protein Fcan01_24383 [Folsomia candida]|uniref:Gustatory receptor n=1 Tax=Folsomia candida TaxID=158441 RepID=A0A226D5W5_FOLCA|nr:hypothetical protein Fcan01_24383 [Folsomia candida]
MENKLVVPIRPKNISKISLLHGARIPFRILQFCGFFPLTVPPKSNQVIHTSWYKSYPTGWLLAIIFSVFVPFIVIAIYGDDGDKPAVLNLQNQGRNTFLIINIAWGLCSVVAPLIVRFHCLATRGCFVEFWRNFVKLVEKFEALDNYEKQIVQQLNYSRAKFITHLVAQLGIYLLESVLYGPSVLGVLDGVGLLSSVQDWTFSLNRILTLFWFHGLIFFLSSYNFIAGKILAKLETERECRKSKMKLEELVDSYIALDHNVSQFNKVYGPVFAVFVIYSLVYLLFCTYVVYVSVRMREFFVIGLSILELLVFTGYFYWLADCASGLEENSKTFCKLVKYSSFEGRNKDGGKDLQIVLEHIKVDIAVHRSQPDGFDLNFGPPPMLIKWARDFGA